MPIGPGKYDNLCTFVREESKAAAAIVIIVGGKYGNGFSIQSLTELPPEKIADMLDSVSKVLRDSAKASLERKSSQQH